MVSANQLLTVRRVKEVDSLFLKKEKQLSGSVGNRGGWRDVKCVKPRGTTLEEGIRK